MQKKRTRNVIRKEIMESVNKCKNSFYLEDTLKIAEIFRKLSDEEEDKKLTGLQWEQILAIQAILDATEEKHASYARSLIRGLESNKRKKG